jgi:hypothetical protein
MDSPWRVNHAGKTLAFIARFEYICKDNALNRAPLERLLRLRIVLWLTD